MDIHEALQPLDFAVIVVYLIVPSVVLSPSW